MRYNDNDITRNSSTDYSDLELNDMNCCHDFALDMARFFIRGWISQQKSLPSCPDVCWGKCHFCDKVKVRESLVPKLRPFKTVDYAGKRSDYKRDDPTYFQELCILEAYGAGIKDDMTEFSSSDDN